MPPSRVLVVCEAESRVASSRRRAVRHALPLVQRPGEPPVALASRVTRLLASMKTNGEFLGSARIECNPRADAEAFVARALIARAVLQALHDAGGGSLVLVGAQPEDVTGTALRSFTSSLLEHVRDPRVTVGLRFEAPDAPPSGVSARLVPSYGGARAQGSAR